MTRVHIYLSARFALFSPRLSRQYPPMLDLMRLLSLSALLVSSVSTASAQQDPADPFSILAPQAEIQLTTPDINPVEDEHAGLQLSREAYLSARGNRGNIVTETLWTIERRTLSGEVISTETRRLDFGDGFVRDRQADSDQIYDFATDRVLTLHADTVSNEPIAASAHRQMDVFTRFTRGGELEEIAGPGGVSFERFWIEAATGIRANEVDLVRQETETGTVDVRRTPDGSAVFSATPGRRGDNAHYDQLSRWMRHTLPIHPDAVDAVGNMGQLPDSFSFLVFSPSSPDGRRETWTLTESRGTLADFPWPATHRAASAGEYALTNETIAHLVSRGLGAAHRPEVTPTTENFIYASQALMQAGDLPGAYLTLMQGTQHEGECLPNTSGELCSAMTRVIIAGLGNQQFQDVANAIANRASEPAALIETLSLYTHRGDYAGAAANLMTAQATARLSETYSASEVLDAFAAAAEIDPAAPLLYWHAGRYAVSQNDIETAWLLFDLACALPSSTSDTPRRETRALQERLRNISPRFFAAAQ